MLSVAATAASVIGQAQTAKAQAKAINTQLAMVQEESRKQASSELFDQMRATRREQGRIRAAAGEAGLALNSGSVEGLLMDSAMQGELKADRSIANMESRNRTAASEADSMMSQVVQPTALGAGIQIASSAAQGWKTIQTAKLKKKAA